MLAGFYGESEKTDVRANNWNRTPVFKRVPAAVEWRLQNKDAILLEPDVADEPALRKRAWIKSAGAPLLNDRGN
jgi:hypothetical protein